jgi:hypothetical protein
MNYCGTDEIGTREWWIEGKLHREDGPAFEYKNGTKTENLIVRMILVVYPDLTDEWWIAGD